jgi:integrase
MHFDARQAKSLAPGQHLIVDGCPGLRLVAAPRWKAWVYRYKDAAGRMKQASFGRWPEMPAAAAVARWEAMRSAKATGADPAKAKRQARAAAAVAATQGTTVAALLRTYVADVLADSRAEASRAAANSMVERLLAEEPDFAARAPAEVDRRTAFQLLQARAATPTATAKLRSLLGAAWDYALDAGEIEPTVPNWWRQVMRGRLKSKGKIVAGKHQGRTHAVLTLEQCGQVIAHAAQHLHGHGFDLLVMYLWTGARGVEILRLRPEHVTDEGGQLWATIPKALTKNAGVPRATDHRIPLFGRAAEVVRRRVAAAVDGDMWGGYNQKAFSTLVYDLMPTSRKSASRPEAAWPVVGWTPHRLRATTRTLLAGLGCPHEVGEAILGHILPEVQGTYNRHSYDAERVRWLGVLAGQLEAAAGLPALP